MGKYSQLKVLLVSGKLKVAPPARTREKAPTGLPWCSLRQCRVCHRRFPVRFTPTGSPVGGSCPPCRSSAFSGAREDFWWPRGWLFNLSAADPSVACLCCAFRSSGSQLIPWHVRCLQRPHVVDSGRFFVPGHPLSWLAWRGPGGVSRWHCAEASAWLRRCRTRTLFESSQQKILCPP